MPLISWNDHMSVSIVEIDTQHQKLITIINDLYDAAKKSKDRELIAKSVNELIDYTEVHFKTEEKYFDHFGYPDSDGHKKEHADFAQKASQFKAKVDQGELGVSFDVIHFLSLWLKDHILETDKKYSAFFNAKGLK